MRDITATVLNRCEELGFALAGICRAEATHYERELLGWLAAGKHGEMDYLRRNVDLRVDPGALVPGAKSIIVVADRYSPLPAGEGPEVREPTIHLNDTITDGRTSPHPTPLPEGEGADPLGKIARYARGDDYHVVMRKRLANLCRELSCEFPQETFRACVDTAPVLEREHAQRAGLGAIGKNTLLIERGAGSYLLLGEIITTLELEPSAASEPDPCGTCTRCIDACPTGAISPWSVDASRCISYLTIEHRGEIDERFYEAMGDWIFGCDICQEVCPHNQPTVRRRPRLSEINPAYAPKRDHFDLLEILNWDEEARRQAFLKSSMKRAKLNMMKRNAIIAADNALRRRDDAALRARIAQLAGDPNEDALVHTTAQAVMRRFGWSDMR